jgi:tRNA threonylcarbamoyl adenosine modification protein (Sua5/YciO/YrdC/YwlC family)
MERLNIHPDNPQLRLVRRVAEVLRAGGLVAFPTDTAYALGCQLGDKEAVERIRRIRELDKHHNFTLMCRDLSELGRYARVDNQVFRLLKANTPGPYTFILNATAEVPRRLVHPKRKTIGLRVPDHRIVRALLEELGEPLMSVTLILPGDAEPLADPDAIHDRLAGRIELLVDGGGHGARQPTTVIDLSGELPVLTRRGAGDPAPFGCA